MHFSQKFETKSMYSYSRPVIFHVKMAFNFEIKVVSAGLYEILVNTKLK